MTSNRPIVKSKVPSIPGTKLSTQNAQLLISTGTPSLDHFIGGGLPIGSIFLVEEDVYGNYAKLALRHFMAEGVVASQSLFVASQDAKPTNLVSELPAVATQTPKVSSSSNSNNDQMKIAWRYQNLKPVETSPTGGQTFGHYYNLTKQMEKEVLENANITYWDGSNLQWQVDGFENNSHIDLLKNIQLALKKGEHFVSQNPQNRRILRIAIDSLGSRMWFCNSHEKMQKDFLKFVYALRALMRESYAVVMITVPVHYFENSPGVVERLEHLSDTVVRLESFAGSPKETNPVFKDYQGLLFINKLPAFNTLAPHHAQFVDLAFRLRNKKFVIEILYFPPELGETTQREQDDIASGGCCSSSGGGCGSSGGSKLDF